MRRVAWEGRLEAMAGTAPHPPTAILYWCSQSCSLKARSIRCRTPREYFLLFGWTCTCGPALVLLACHVTRKVQATWCSGSHPAPVKREPSPVARRCAKQRRVLVSVWRLHQRHNQILQRRRAGKQLPSDTYAMSKGQRHHSLRVPTCLDWVVAGMPRNLVLKARWLKLQQQAASFEQGNAGTCQQNAPP